MDKSLALRRRHARGGLDGSTWLMLRPHADEDVDDFLQRVLEQRGWQTVMLSSSTALTATGIVVQSFLRMLVFVTYPAIKIKPVLMP